MSDDAHDTPQEEIRDTLTPFEAYDAVPLCPTCFNETAEDWEFCPTCYAPLGPFAGYDPLKRIYTLRFLIYQGVTRPTSLIIVIGIWLIYVEWFWPLAMISHDTYSPIGDVIFFTVIEMLSVAISLWTIFLVSRNFFLIKDDLRRHHKSTN